MGAEAIEELARALDLGDEEKFLRNTLKEI